MRRVYSAASGCSKGIADTAAGTRQCEGRGEVTVKLTAWLGMPMQIGQARRGLRLRVFPCVQAAPTAWLAVGWGVVHCTDIAETMQGHCRGIAEAL